LIEGKKNQREREREKKRERGEVKTRSTDASVAQLFRFNAAGRAAALFPLHKWDKFGVHPLVGIINRTVMIDDYGGAT